MGWETRHNSKYLYRKRRIGTQVHSIYLGTGPVAELIEHRKEMEQAVIQLQQDKTRKVLEGLESDAIWVNSLSDLIDELLAIEIGKKGYHNHRGQWRKRRTSL